MTSFVSYSPCVYGVPFGAFALASCILAFAERTALASYHLPLPAKRNGGGLIGRVEVVDMRVNGILPPFTYSGEYTGSFVSIKLEEKK